MYFPSCAIEPKKNKTTGYEKLALPRHTNTHLIYSTGSVSLLLLLLGPLPTVNPVVLHEQIPVLKRRIRFLLRVYSAESNSEEVILLSVLLQIIK